MDNSINKKVTFLTFFLGDELFAIYANKVVEVLEVQKTTKVPRTPDYIKGVINFRGDIIPVIDLRIKFDMNAKDFTEETIFIVVNFELSDKKIKLAAIADALNGVFSINQSEINEVPELGNPYKKEYLYGIFKHNDNFVNILNVENIFTPEKNNI